jgi:ketosteroid isomerase-like protein
VLIVLDSIDKKIGGRDMDREKMEAYYRTFNSGDHEALAEFYSDDVIFEYRDVKLEGRRAVISYFAELQKGFAEKIHPRSILVDGNKVAVEMEDTFTAKVDLPGFLGKSLKQGESITARFSGFYDTHDNKICRVRLYSF